MHSVLDGHVRIWIGLCGGGQSLCMVAVDMDVFCPGWWVDKPCGAMAPSWTEGGQAVWCHGCGVAVHLRACACAPSWTAAWCHGCGVAVYLRACTCAPSWMASGQAVWCGVAVYLRACTCAPSWMASGQAVWCGVYLRACTCPPSWTSSVVYLRACACPPSWTAACCGVAVHVLRPGRLRVPRKKRQ
jgi:hypothetical protein